MAQMKKSAEQGQEQKLSRRDFMARSSALGISAATATSFLDSSARAAPPKKGGRLRIGIGDSYRQESLNPVTWGSDFSQQMGHCLHNWLAEGGEDGRLVPELAEHWESSPDAKVWTFELRKDVEYHNGKTVDARDVVASVQHHRSSESNSAARSLLESITTITTDGRHVVVVTLDQGNADFPYLVSDYHIPILPANDEGIDWQSGVGAGPYMLQDFEPRVHASFTRNPNYWKTDRAHFDEVEILFIWDKAARISALKQGAIDVCGCERKTVDLLAQTPGIHVHETMGGSHVTFPMRTDTPPFDNNDVRMALKYGIDRQVLLDTILYGHGLIGNDQPISPADRYYANELPQREYEPDRARHHLRKAGLSGLTVDLSTAETVFTGAENAAVLYKEHAAKAGITINVVHEPNDAYWQTAYMNKPWSTSVWSGRPTADWMFSTAYVPGAQWNETFWDHPRFNALLVEARAELDEAKRRDMYVELQRIVRDEGGAVLPFFYSFLFASTDKLQHGPLLDFWNLDGLRLSERWWFA